MNLKTIKLRAITMKTERKIYKMEINIFTNPCFPWD